MTKLPLVIAGGGIAGLAAALAVPAQDVLLLEKAAAFGEVGAGLQLGPNAVAALRQLGAWEAVSGIAATPPEIHMRDGLTGRLLKRIPLGTAFEHRFGAPYRTAHRADLHSALLAVARVRAGIAFHFEAPVEQLAAKDDAVEIASVDGRRILAKAVIAADGVHSRVRQMMFPGTPPVDSGLVFYRALISFPQQDEGVALDCVNLWMMPGGHVVHYPVGRPARLNIVAVTPSGDTPLRFFDRACPALKAMLTLLPDAPSWPGLYTPTLPHWHKGNVILLGDAAHATLPFLAQGAAMALEDAAELQRALGRHAGFTVAFADVSAARMARAGRLHAETLRAGQTYHLNGPQAWARNMVLRALPPDMFMSRLSWLYGFPPG